ncbi:hypothetical protein SCALM49S_08814 [Streptomyces californicus]
MSQAPSPDLAHRWRMICSCCCPSTSPIIPSPSQYHWFAAVAGRIACGLPGVPPVTVESELPFWMTND